MRNLSYLQAGDAAAATNFASQGGRCCLAASAGVYWTGNFSVKAEEAASILGGLAGGKCHKADEDECNTSGCSDMFFYIHARGLSLCDSEAARTYGAMLLAWHTQVRKFRSTFWNMRLVHSWSVPLKPWVTLLKICVLSLHFVHSPSNTTSSGLRAQPVRQCWSRSCSCFTCFYENSKVLSVLSLKVTKVSCFAYFSQVEQAGPKLEKRDRAIMANLLKTCVAKVRRLLSATG